MNAPVVDYVWLIPMLPLAAAVLIGLFGAKVLKGAAGLPAIAAMLGSTGIALWLLAGFMNGSLHPQAVHYFDWIIAGHFYVPVEFWLDSLTALYLTFVTGIATLIFVYGTGYMKGDYGYWRFFAFMSIFVFFMTVLVLANNFVLLYLGWEGVGLASYLLIGYYYPRPSAVAAAKKAFITNRIGDFGFAIGIFLIYTLYGSVVFFSGAGHAGGVLGTGAAHNTEGLYYWIPFLLMVGAFGKSAQFPLHVWLPDAMEGPTPVSALIHAATMVTAGIYMIARCMPLFNADALLVVACVGAFTAFMAASMAFCQYDLKRIWAYSTLSQLGYMFLGLGVMAAGAAVFHVFTHAFFKALLFLASGSVMHAMGGELDIRKMSGIRKVMPITALLMLAGCLALSGVPGFAGYFSKDEIIAAAANYPGAWGWLLGSTGLLVALMTSYYTFRTFFRVFMGPLALPATAGQHEPSPFALAADEHHADHGAGAHGASGHEAAGHDPQSHAAHGPNDGPASMWAPLIILALGAIFAGYLGVLWKAPGQAEGGWLQQFVAQSPSLAAALPMGEGSAAVAAHAGAAPAGHEAGHLSRMVLFVLSLIIPIVGIAIAWYFHLKNRHAATVIGIGLRPLVKFLENRWYIDELYRHVITGGLWLLALVLASIDRFLVDGLVTVVGGLPAVVGYTLKPTQRGLLQRYAVGMVLGVGAIILGVIWIMR